ncbi:MAG: YraN family protein [Planctomycetota bacterium]
MIGRLLRRRGGLGPWGERRAASYLRRRGFRVVGRNVRTRIGEADLVCVAPDRRTMVLVEVKTRDARGVAGDRRPESQLTGAKRAKLRRLVDSLARSPAWRDRPWRIDVLAVERRERGRPEIRHLERAVTG